MYAKDVCADIVAKTLMAAPTQCPATAVVFFLTQNGGIEKRIEKDGINKKGIDRVI